MKARHVRRARSLSKSEIQENRWRYQAVFKPNDYLRLCRFRLVCTAQKMQERAYFDRLWGTEP